MIAPQFILPLAHQPSAVLSDCGRFRYRLGRRWGDGAALAFIMLNPSTADATSDDATIRRCIRFTREHGFDAIDVVNLFAYRATDPRDLARAGFPVGPENDGHIEDAAAKAGNICVAWGAHPEADARAEGVLRMLFRINVEPRCLRITRSGYPQHPLMLPAACRLTPYTLDAVYDALMGMHHDA